LMVRCIIDFS